MRSKLIASLAAELHVLSVPNRSRWGQPQQENKDVIDQPSIRMDVKRTSVRMTFPPKTDPGQSGTLGQIMEDKVMPRKRFSAEEIVNKLREADVLLSKGQTVALMCKRIEVTDQTYYRWRREYGGLRVDQARRLKALEKENGRLKKLVADQALDMAILKEVAQGNF